MSPIEPYSFRPFTRADLPLTAKWLQTPEVVRWWGDPDEQLALVAEDLEEVLMRQWVVEFNGRPFAYVQAYAPASWPQPHLRDLPAGSIAIDAFIGEPDMLGRGHGSAFLKAFGQMLVKDGASAVVIDPDAENLRARRAYARAGFVEQQVVDTADGPTAVMVFTGLQPQPRA